MIENICYKANHTHECIRFSSYNKNIINNCIIIIKHFLLTFEHNSYENIKITNMLDEMKMLHKLNFHS